MLKDRQAVRFKPGFSPAIFFLLVPLHTAAASGLTAVIGNDDAVRTSEARVATHPYFEGVFHQQERYSCGTAALASLLTYWIGDKTSENSLLDRLLGQHGSADRERIFARGLDTKDLATLASSLGYQQRWQTVSIEHYRRVREPVIIFMVYEGEPHWTIYKGYANGEVYLADPSLGNVRMPASEFERMWAIQDDSRIGLMWALQRDDLRNLGQSSPLVDLTPSNHRTPSELRAMAAFGRVPGTRQSITTSLSKSRSSTVVGLYGQAVLLSTSQQTLRQSWSGEVGKGLVTDVSIAYSRSSTRASVGTGVFEDHDSGWRDLTISTLKLVPVNSESIAAAFPAPRFR